MATSLGSLVVSLGLDAAQFFSGLTKAQNDVQKFARSMNNLFSTLGVGLSFAGLTELSRRTILAAEHMQNLATDTGSTVEEISRLSNIAKISGTSFETFESALLRLAAGLNGSEELSTKTADALKFLGITSKDPAEAMQELATALNKFADGAGKAAIARDLFGRGGAAFLSTLKSIAENQDQVNTRTTEQAEKATKLAESMRSLAVNSTAVGNAILNDLVPPLNSLVGALTDAINKSDGLGQALKNVALLNPFQSFGQNINELNKEIAHEQDIINKGGASIWTSLLGEDHGKSEVDLALREIARLTAARDIAKQGQLRAALAIGSEAGNRDARDIRFAQKPTLNFVSGKGAGGAADDPTRKLLEAQLSALKAITEQEKAVLQNREQFLQAIFDRGESSIADYYANKQAAQNEDLKITTENYRQEIAAIDNFIKNSATAKARAEGEKQRVDATSRQTLAVIQAAGRAQAAIDDQKRATKEYTDQVTELNAKMLELAGNTRAAALIRFDAQNQLFLDRAQKGGDTETVAKVAALREQLGLTADLGRAQQAYSNSLEAVAIAAARIDFLRSTGALTEIEALNQRSALSRANIANLTAEIDAYQKLAEGIKNPEARAKALNDINAMRLAVDQLAASSDLLAKKFNDAFADATADTIFKLTTGMESLTDAVKDFEKQLIASISRIAAQNIAENIFKPGSTGGSGFDIGSIFAKLFSGSIPGLASGGDVVPGKTIAVGEKGVELFIPKVAGTIVPNSVLSSKRAARAGNTTLNINVLPGATRASADQAASAMVRALQRAQSREA